MPRNLIHEQAKARHSASDPRPSTQDFIELNDIRKAHVSQSAGLFFNCKCNVGGGISGAPPIGRIYGMGCLLDKNHVLSAAHCWTRVKDRFEWPAAMTLDGLFRCQLAFCNEEADIMLLRMIERIQPPPPGLEQSEHYAQLSGQKIFLGTQVGSISQLTLHDSLEDASTRTHFSTGFVSMWLLERNPPLCALSETVMQKGFSGSPVFLPSDSVVGVLVQSLSFRADFHDLNAPIYVLPVISPIRPVFQELCSALKAKSL